MSTVVPPIGKESTSVKTPQPTISEMTKSVVTEAAKEVLQNVIHFMNKLDVNSALEYYSNDSDTRYVENGYLYPSLTALKDAYIKLLPGFEFMDQTVKSWDVIVLSEDAALVTLPMHARVKVKGRPEIEFDFVCSSVVQKRNGKWLLINTHESWLNAAEAMAAMTPPETKKHK